MRTTMAFGVGCLMLGCSGENTGAPPPAPVDWHAFELARSAVPATPGPTPKERALAEGYLTAIASQGFAGLGPLLDNDAHFSFPGTADGRGREAVLRGHESIFGALDQRVMTASRIWRTDDEQTVEWTLAGVQNRDWMGVPATHKAVVLKGVALLWTKDDGILTDVHVVFDVAVGKAQLGAGPKELAGLPAPTAAGGAPVVAEQARSPEEAATVTTARAWLDALERNDEAGYVAAMTDDVVVETLSRPQPYRGKEELRGYFKAERKAISQLDTAIDNAWGIGHFAVIEYTIAGEQLGALGWVPPQRDKVVRLHVVDVLEMTGGKISHVRRYDDPGEIVGTGP